MITATALEIISGAGQDLGVLSLGQEFSGAEGEAALGLLNLVIDSLGIDRALLFTLVRTTKVLASGTASYTVGAAGSIVLARPSRIAKAGLILDTSATYPTEVPVDVLTDEEYAAWPQKTEQAGRSRAVFYNRGIDGDGYGTVYPLPIPNVATTQLVLYTPGGAVSQFAELQTEYEFVEGLALVLRTQFALQFAASYPQAKVTKRYESRAAWLKTNFQSAHLVVPKKENTPFMGGSGYFDQDAGTFR
jgi:hypothetical protein